LASDGEHLTTKSLVRTPATLAEAEEILADPCGPVLVIEGGATKSSSDLLGEAQHEVLSTKGLTGIVFYDPADGVVVARAGTPLAELEEELATHGQWLGIDPPFVKEGATLGGIFSTNDAGPQRYCYGTLRDLAIGVTVVTGDGLLAHAGGRVIKNVAGYDLTRLYCGAHGTLGLVAELAVRVHPRPRCSKTLRIRGALSKIDSLDRIIRRSGVVVVALDFLSGTSAWGEVASRGPSRAAPARDGIAATEAVDVWGVWLVRLRGQNEASLSISVATLTREISRAGTRDDDPPPTSALFASAGAPRHCREARDRAGALSSAVELSVLTGLEEEREWEFVGEILAGALGDTVVRCVTRPTQVFGVIGRCPSLACRYRVTVAVDCHALIGITTLRLRGGDQAGFIAALRLVVTALGGFCTLRRRSPSLGREVDSFGPLPGGVALMAELKRALDPHRRLAPGSFVGGI